MPTTSSAPVHAAFWPLVLVAAAILMITMGFRQSLGLFIMPMHTTTGASILSISFAMAVGQFFWGASQPVFGALADRYGPKPVLVFGGLLLAAGIAITPLVRSEWALIFSLGVMAAAGAGAGAGSFSILIGATAQRLSPERRAFAAGFINAGGSFGQVVFAPINQLMISAFGWMQAMGLLALASLATLPLASKLGGSATKATPAANDAGLWVQLRAAFQDRSYWCLHLGFFTCGFHIAFLVTHLPGEVGICRLSVNVAATSLAVIGIANIVGSLAAGALGARYRMKYILCSIYAIRAVAIGLYLLAPKTPATFYAFAAALGLTWLATVPPTAGLVGKLFGTRYLGTLFGMTLLSHQIGGFLGAYLGGLAFVHLGDFNSMWITDMALALAAALVNLPIREARLVPRPLPV
jgi:MFS family permease